MPNILIATEGSICSAEAVRHFARITGSGSYQITLLAVISPSRDASGHPAAAVHYHREAEAAHEALDLAALDLAREGFQAKCLTRVGEPAEAILAVAREIAADLIVLGSHNRKGLDRLFNGSVSETVLNDAPCAVFILPQGAALPTPVVT